MLKVDVNGQFPFEVDPKNQDADWDIRQIEPNHFHIIKDNRTYNVYLLEHDESGKQVKLRINGADYEVTIQDQYDLLLQKLGMNRMADAKVNLIKAPMPGLVLEVMVAAGDEINKGDQVLILEAMKMENIIKSPGGGKVKRIAISKGDAVEKNEMLIELE